MYWYCKVTKYIKLPKNCCPLSFLEVKSTAISRDPDYQSAVDYNVK